MSVPKDTKYACTHIRVIHIPTSRFKRKKKTNPFSFPQNVRRHLKISLKTLYREVVIIVKAREGPAVKAQPMMAYKHIYSISVTSRGHCCIWVKTTYIPKMFRQIHFHQLCVVLKKISCYTEVSMQRDLYLCVCVYMCVFSSQNIWSSWHCLPFHTSVSYYWTSLCSCDIINNNWNQESLLYA